MFLFQRKQLDKRCIHSKDRHGGEGGREGGGLSFLRQPLRPAQRKSCRTAHSPHLEQSTAPPLQRQARETWQLTAPGSLSHPTWVSLKRNGETKQKTAQTQSHAAAAGASPRRCGNAWLRSVKVFWSEGTSGSYLAQPLAQSRSRQITLLVTYGHLTGLFFLFSDVQS